VAKNKTGNCTNGDGMSVVMKVAS